MNKSLLFKCDRSLVPLFDSPIAGVDPEAMDEWSQLKTRAWTGAERVLLEKALGADPAEIEAGAKIVCHGAFTADGARAFSDEDWERLVDADSLILFVACQKIAVVNKLDKVAQQKKGGS